MESSGVQAPLAQLPRLTGAVNVRAAAHARLERAQDCVDLRMVRGAHLHRARVRVLGVYVVVMDQAGADAHGLPEEEANGAVVARELAPSLSEVDRSLHWPSREKRYRWMRPACTPSWQMRQRLKPEKILRHVITPLAPELKMVWISPRSELAQLARLPGVLEPEAREHVRIANALARLGIHSHRSALGRA